MTTPHRKPTPRKAKRIKAQIRWEDELCGLWYYRKNAGYNPKRIAQLDCSDEAALIEQVAEHLFARRNDTTTTYDAPLQDYFRTEARAVLESLGIIKRKHLPAIHAKRGKNK